jgi:hypothetical protein
MNMKIDGFSKYKFKSAIKRFQSSHFSVQRRKKPKK